MILNLADKKFCKKCRSLLISGDNSKRKIFTEIPTPGVKFTIVDSGFSRLAALDENEQLWTCDNHGIFHLGMGNKKLENMFKKMSDKLFSTVSCGYHTAAIDKGGKLWMYGNNFFGQLGLDKTKNKKKLTQVSEKIFVKVSCGSTFTITIGEDGYLWGCGKLAPGHDEILKTLTKISQRKFVVVGCRDSHMAAIDVDGYLWVCGGNDFGRLGFISQTCKQKVLTKFSQEKFIKCYCIDDNTIAIDENENMW